MKQIIFTAVFAFTFCWVGFGQEIKCEKQTELVYEYPNSSPSSEKKHKMEYFRMTLEENPNCVGIILIQAKRNDEIFREYKKIQKAFLFLRLPLEKITFAIIPNSKEEKVEFWTSLPKTEIPNCEECIIIRAKDFPKLQELFKPITKKRKN